MNEDARCERQYSCSSPPFEEHGLSRIYLIHLRQNKIHHMASRRDRSRFETTLNIIPEELMEVVEGIWRRFSPRHGENFYLLSCQSSFSIRRIPLCMVPEHRLLLGLGLGTLPARQGAC